MVSLILCFVVLIIGYMLFSRIADKNFSPDSRKTPSIAINDGVDCVPMSKPKLFLVQLLNIAGTGPIFGPIMGAVFGPIVFLWIIFGTILGGAVHDFMVGMVSSRHKGVSIAELSGLYVGKVLKWIMRGFSVLLLVLCGTVFLVTPASILSQTSGMNQWIWVVIIVAYYFLATILPIDKIIGKFYPIFGILLLVMAFSVLIGAFAQGYATNIPEIWNSFGQEHPNGLPTWPFMFVTVACGAISGFHATQSPMVSKCIQNEKQGRQVFYGAMVGEAIIALVWASVGVAFYGSAQALQDSLNRLGGAGGVVTEVSKSLLGSFGGVLAIIGVVVCPITSGDTAFRGARLIVAEATHLDQKKIRNRLILTVPIVGAGVGLAFLDFNVLWRYFAAANQTLAMVALWIASFYLLKKGKYKNGEFITAIPATFMVAVSMTYICVAPECINLPGHLGPEVGYLVGYIIGGVLSVSSIIAFCIYHHIYYKKHEINKERPYMFKYLKKEKNDSKKMLNDFKMELLLNKYYVLQKRDFDVAILKILVNYKERYEFMQKLRVATRVEEILNINEKLNEISKIKEKNIVKKFTNFLTKIELKCSLFYKKKTSKFIKCKPMDVGTYFHFFKYILNYTLKHGVVYSNNRNDLDSLMVVFPNNFQRIDFDSFKAIPYKLYSLFTGKLFELYRAVEFDDISRFHEIDKVNNRYWYIYQFNPKSKDEDNQKLLEILTKFTEKNNLKIYVDILYKDCKKLFENNNFKIVKEEVIDYAKIPYTFMVKDN